MMTTPESTAGAVEQLIAPEAAAVQQPTGEEAAPETKPEQVEEAPEAKAEAERDKAIRNLQRRVDRKHAQAAVAEERARLAEQRAAELEARLSGSEVPSQEPKVDPHQLAEQIANKREFDKRSDQVAREGQKRFGSAFVEAVKTFAEEAGPLFDANGLPTALGEAVLDSDDPAALLQHVGQDDDLAAELRGMRPTQMARRLAQIEAELKAPPQPKQSTAPKPVAPVKPTASGGSLSDNLSIEEWQRRFYEMRSKGLR